jgi:multiple sugar transport system permease protein
VYALAAFSVLPYAWLVLEAFRPRSIITASPPSLDPGLTLENFSLSYNGQSILALSANSLIIGLGTVVVSLIAGTPAAYFFARIRTRWTRQLFLLVLSTRMAPPIAICLPLFTLFAVLGLRGTYLAIILTESVFNVAFVVWFLEGCFASTPQEIEMAAQIDGCSRVGALLRVVLPLNLPALGAAAAFVFLFSWNEYLMASLLTDSLTRPLTPALPGFIAQATSQWGSFCAVALIASLPPLAMAVMARHYLARAFTVGSIADA